MALSRAERRNRAHWIYFLRCPYTFEIRYVGKTTNVKQRAKAHRSKHTSTAKQAWIEELNSQGKEFVFDAVLGPVNSGDADRIENILIIRHSLARPGRLVNGDCELRFSFNRSGRVEIIRSVPRDQIRPHHLRLKLNASHFPQLEATS